mgnify:CR=1 FL=1
MSNAYKIKPPKGTFVFLPPGSIAPAGDAPAPVTPATAEISGVSLAGFIPSGGRAVYATHAPGRPDDLFVLDQRGLVQVLDLTTGQFNPQPFLDIRGFVDDQGNEQGLLGLAFHPDFETNGHFYVNYPRDPGPGIGRGAIATPRRRR